MLADGDEPRVAHRLSRAGAKGLLAKVFGEVDRNNMDGKSELGQNLAFLSCGV